MKPLDMPTLTAEHVDAVTTLYRTTHTVRLRTCAQMVLLATELQLGVRECEGTVRCWLNRYAAHGIEGPQDFFDRYNREPSRILLVIGSHAQNVI